MRVGGGLVEPHISVSQSHARNGSPIDLQSAHPASVEIRDAKRVKAKVGG